MCVLSAYYLSMKGLSSALPEASCLTRIVRAVLAVLAVHVFVLVLVLAVSWSFVRVRRTPYAALCTTADCRRAEPTCQASRHDAAHHAGPSQPAPKHAGTICCSPGVACGLWPVALAQDLWPVANVARQCASRSTGQQLQIQLFLALTTVCTRTCTPRALALRLLSALAE